MVWGSFSSNWCDANLPYLPLLAKHPVLVSSLVVAGPKTHRFVQVLSFSRAIGQYSVKLPRFLLESQTRNAVRLSEFLLDFHGSPVNALVAPFISCFSTGNCLARYKQFRIDLQCSFVTPRTVSINLISAVVTSSRNHWKLLHWSWLRSFFLELTSPKSPRSCPIRS